jgi:hypothetical protein
VNGSSHEAALIRITALGARMRMSSFSAVNEVEERNEEDSGVKCSNEHDVHGESRRIIRP